MARKSTLDDIPLENLTTQQRYYVRHKEQIRAKQEKWRAANPDRYKEYYKRSNEKRKMKRCGNTEETADGTTRKRLTPEEIVKYFKNPDNAAAAMWVMKNCNKNKK